MNQKIFDHMVKFYWMSNKKNRIHQQKVCMRMSPLIGTNTKIK